MCQIKIRFNKKRTGDHDAWRVFEDDKQHLVANFVASDVELVSNSTFEEGEQKWNVCCVGEVKIVNGNAYIRGIPA